MIARVRLVARVPAGRPFDLTPIELGDPWHHQHVVAEGLRRRPWIDRGGLGFQSQSSAAAALSPRQPQPGSRWPRKRWGLLERQTASSSGSSRTGNSWTCDGLPGGQIQAGPSPQATWAATMSPPEPPPDNQKTWNVLALSRFQPFSIPSVALV